MKRGTSTHPKTDALMRLLQINRREATGLLQMLWEWVGDYAPQGDIGRWSDADIAAAVEWTSADPVQLVRALVQSGFVDEHKKHRLIVHDWHEHLEDYVRKRLERKDLRPFCAADNGRQRRTTADNGGQRRPATPRLAMPSQAMPSPVTDDAPSVDGATTRSRHSPGVTWNPRAGWSDIPPDDRNAWRQAFPACDLDRQLARMHAWLVANPTKVKKNWRAFIVRWLTKEQDRGGDSANQNGVHVDETRRAAEIAARTERVAKQLGIEKSR